MHKAFAAFRTIAALALVLSLVAGLFSVRGVSAQDATPVPVEPEVSTAPAAVDGEAGEDTGTPADDGGDITNDIYTIAYDQIELRARLEAGIGNQGTTVFTVDGNDLGADAVGDSIPLSGNTFTVRTSTNDIIDSVTTGSNGLIYLDAPVGVEFVIVDEGTGFTSDILFIADASLGRTVVTATQFANDQDVPDSGNTAYPIAVDQIELRTRTFECPADSTPVTVFSFNDEGSTFADCVEIDIAPAAVGDSAPSSLTVEVVVHQVARLGVLSKHIGVDAL